MGNLYVSASRSRAKVIYYILLTDAIVADFGSRARSQSEFDGT
jgi:hypothetical protein